MFRFVVTIFCFLTLVYADAIQESLNTADNLSKSSKTSNLFKAYNEYKTLYLRSVTGSDNDLKEKSLQGIIKTGTKLKIDVSEYNDILHSTNKTSMKKDNRVVLTSINSLSVARWDDDTLVVKFEKDLDKSQVKYFTIHDEKHNRYRYIFDIQATQLSKKQNIKKDGIASVKLSQFDTQAIRLVIENQEQIDISYEIEGGDLKISTSAKKTDLQKIITSKKQDVKIEKNETKAQIDDGDDEMPLNLKKYSKSSKVKTIMIDPGHGGKDSGAVGYHNLYEKTVVLNIAQDVASILTKRGYKVFMTRHDDTFIELKERTASANRKNADLFISIHANAVAANFEESYGIETYFLSPSRSGRATRVAEKENSIDISDMSSYGKSTFLKFTTNLNRVASNKLAIDIQKGMLGNLKKSYSGVVDSGVREGPFWVLVGAQMPAVLVETGFITNPEEGQRLADPDYEEKLAYGIANGVDRYFINN
jgi:N-acetylmuramoyl-L-alanine amidase